MNNRIILIYEVTGKNNIPKEKSYTLQQIEYGILRNHFENNRTVKLISISFEEK